MTAAPRSMRVPRPSVVDAAEIIPTIGATEIWAAPSRIVPVIPAIQACVGRPTLVYALPGAGKSIVLWSAAIAGATGLSMLGAAPLAPLRVLWLDGEVGGPLTSSRAQRIARALGVGPRDLGDRLRVAIYPSLSIDDPTAERILAATCAGYTLVILDSLTALSGDADETSPEMGRIMLMLARVSGRTGAAIVVVHHARRDGEIRGSTSIDAGSECIWRMRVRGRESIMHHQRSPIGAPLPDLALRIRDVAIDGDPLAGLAVDLASTTPEAVAIRSLETEILEYLAAHDGHAGGADTLAASMGRKAARVREAVEALIAARAITRAGAGRATRIEVLR